MPSLIASVKSDGRSGGKPGWVVLEYTEPVSGTSFTNTVRLAGSDGAQALADSLVPRKEQGAFDGELITAFELMKSGIDPHTRAWVWATTEDINQFCVRSAANLKPDGPDGENIFSMIACEDMFDSYGWSNSKVNSYLEGATVGAVNGWRGWVSGQSTSMATYINGVPPQTP